MNTPLASKPGQTATSFQEDQEKPVANGPTIQEIEDWDKDELLKWIQQKKPKLLGGENLEKFKKECISGHTFLKYAGNTDFFQKNCHLPAGTSSDLADLASEIKTGSKHYLSYHGRNSDSQLTVSQGDSKQAGGEEQNRLGGIQRMQPELATAGSKSKYYLQCL
jgi:hypothetical protein